MLGTAEKSKSSCSSDAISISASGSSSRPCALLMLATFSSAPAAVALSRVSPCCSANFLLFRFLFFARVWPTTTMVSSICGSKTLGFLAAAGTNGTSTCKSKIPSPCSTFDSIESSRSFVMACLTRYELSLMHLWLTLPSVLMVQWQGYCLCGRPVL